MAGQTIFKILYFTSLLVKQVKENLFPSAFSFYFFPKIIAVYDILNDMNLNTSNYFFSK